MSYHLAVIIGRFQPFHNVHLQLVERALDIADQVLILLGSHKSAPDVKNPFTADYREGMVTGSLDLQDRERVSFAQIRDYQYSENTWISEIQNKVRDKQTEIVDSWCSTFEEPERHSKLLDVKTALVGYFKDDTSYYLSYFPQWKFEQLHPNKKESTVLNATDVRKLWFEGEDYTPFVPEFVAGAMEEFSKTTTFENLKKEYSYIKQYKKDTEFKGVPFAPTFVTTDAVVTAKGHVLVVKRGANPGKGLLALPGGFLEPSLTLKDNMLKELKEETKIHIPKQLLESSVVNQHVFDYPQRSLRGRTVTHAFHLELYPKMEDGLPLVKGGDDAEKAFWMPVAEVAERSDEFFEDHLEIINFFVGRS